MPRCPSNNLSTKRSQISKRSKMSKPKDEDLSDTMKLYRTDITAAAKKVQNHINEESGGVMHRVSIGSTIPVRSPMNEQSQREWQNLSPGNDTSRSPSSNNYKQYQEKEVKTPTVPNMHAAASSVIARQITPSPEKKQATEKRVMPVLRSHLMLNSNPTHASVNDTGTQENPVTAHSEFPVGASYERVKQLAKTGENFNTLKFDPLRRNSPITNSTAFPNNRKLKEDGNFAC